jgi:transcriptional regulator with AAA-type ATPase domain/tetratricopeptide (TPR) repeat protein
MQWIAERFFTDGRGTWIDAASGCPVRLHVTASGPAAADIEWSDWCARLARLRHPGLHPLLDYGAASPVQHFEAYDASRAGAPGRGVGPAAAGVRVLLKTAGLMLDSARERLASCSPSADRHAGRAVGLELQPRPLLDAMDDALDQAKPVGPAAITVVGAAGSGLRTSRLLVARSARLKGFVPMSVGVLVRHPALLDLLTDRHLCLLDDESASRSFVGAVVSRIARASTRRHVLIRFTRTQSGASPTLALTPMRTDALLRMVLTVDDGPADPKEVEAAARTAAGLPGSLVAALSTVYAARRQAVMCVHEARAEFTEPPVEPVTDPPVIAGRLLGAALRAAERSAALQRAGRHAAAARVLDRGVRVLVGRQRRQEAAACTLERAVLALDRGHLDTALAAFASAGDLAPGSELAVRAAVGLGVALTDAARFAEAEAALRGGLAAAVLNGYESASVSAAAALARCLLWDGRSAEAMAVVTTHRGVAASRAQRARLLGVLARCEMRMGRIPAAVASAREGQQAAQGNDDPRVIASLDLTVAQALAAAGDAAGARAALGRAVRVARASHLPLFRIRRDLLTIAWRDPGWQRCATVLRRARLPRLLADRLAVALDGARSTLEPVSELEHLLDLTQRSPDERTALARICKAVGERLGAGTVAVITPDDRTLAIEGRSSRQLSPGLREVVSCGARVLPDRCREPLEAAEPVRYGGEVVAALACRWAPGSTVDRDSTVMVLRAAALSASGPVRALLDAAVPVRIDGPCRDLIGESPAAASLRDAVARAARAPFPVLVEGESGSGKELVAKGVHLLSSRRDRRFCALNCAALTDELVEAELFGHARGAFTGAATERAGLFEEADGGTLFLDEIGELSARAQAKLLRVLQEGEVRRVGENLPRRVDVRVVAATNRRLEEEVAAGRFRADLRFRLDVVRITVPPLRDRPDDIPLLANHFWREASSRVGSQATLGPEALAALARYDWPGNVRELQNVIAWIAVHSPRRGRVGLAAIPAHVAGAARPPASSTFEAARADFERRFIRAALAGANGKPSRAAAALGVSRQGLAKMMRRLQIEAP